MNEAEFDTAIRGTVVDGNEPAGKELALTARTVQVIPEGAWTTQTVTVVLPPPMTPLETLMAFTPLPKFNWRKWLDDVGDAVHDGDRDTVETLLDLGLRKGFK